MFKTLLLFPALLAVLASNGQLTQSIRGKISDRESEGTLPGVTVLITDVDPVIGAITDADGYYILHHVPVGRHTLVARYTGYQDALLTNVLVGSAKEVIINISMQEAFRDIREVTISARGDKHKANNDMALVSARSFSVDETQRYAASVDDPARMAQSFAGVGNTDDVSNEIIIRGNSPRGLLWRLNGMEIPSPNHFTNDGASGGGVSALSNNMLDNSDFLTGAFPAEYGNAVSGVFDVKLRKGNNQKREYVTQIGVMGTDIAMEGPFSNNYNGSYLLNYRYSTLGLLQEAGFLNLADINTFQDFAFNVSLPTTKMGTFGVFGLGGLSLARNKVESDTSLWENEAAGNRYSFHSNMGVAGLSHQYFFNEHTYLKTTIALTGQQLKYVSDSISKEDFSEHISGREHFNNTATRINILLNKKFNARNTIRTGTVVSFLGYNIASAAVNDMNVYQTNLDDKGSTTTIQAYGQWKHRIGEKWILNAGLHYFGLQLTHSSAIEPRAGIQYQFNEGQSLSFGAGMHSRMESMSVYNSLVPDQYGNYGRNNLNLGLTRAVHYVLGYDRLLNEQLRLKLEAYYQHLYNVPVSANSSSSYTILNESAGFPDVQLNNKGTAYNTGLEITLEKFFSNRYYYLLTGSVFDSKYKDGAGKQFNTRYNAHFRFTLLGGKEWPAGKNNQNLWALNGKLIYSGGNRYTPIDLAQSVAQDETVLINSLNYSSQVPNYWRIDLSGSYRINKEKTAHIFSLQVQNATNRENIYGYYFEKEKQQIGTIYQFGLIPVLKYRLEF